MEVGPAFVWAESDGYIDGHDVGGDRNRTYQFDRCESHETEVAVQRQRSISRKELPKLSLPNVKSAQA